MRARALATARAKAVSVRLALQSVLVILDNTSMGRSARASRSPLHDSEGLGQGQGVTRPTCSEECDGGHETRVTALRTNEPVGVVIRPAESCLRENQSTRPWMASTTNAVPTRRATAATNRRIEYLPQLQCKFTMPRRIPGLAGPVRLLTAQRQTEHLPPFFAQCLQYLQFLQAWQVPRFEGVQVAAWSTPCPVAARQSVAARPARKIRLVEAR